MLAFLTRDGRNLVWDLFSFLPGGSGSGGGGFDGGGGGEVKTHVLSCRFVIKDNFTRFTGGAGGRL